jgi:ABC-type spermidine/putrescine transport system permease subunit I
MTSKAIMQFTPKELRHIQRLRKQERQWSWTRWALLAIGVMSAALCVAFGYFVSLLIRDSQHQFTSGDALVFALFWTKCCVYFLLSTWSFVTVITKWHGDAGRTLTLKLLEEHEKGERSGN